MEIQMTQKKAMIEKVQNAEIMQELLNKLAEIPRRGWVLRGVQNPENVAEHSLGVATQAMMYCPHNLNARRVYELALIHDLPEIYAGDVTPQDCVPKAEKEAAERQAMERIVHETGCAYLMPLFEEFLEQKTPESHFVNDMDRYQCVLQAEYYDKNNLASQELVPEFYAYANSKMKTSIGKNLMEMFYRRWDPQAQQRRILRSKWHGGVVYIAGQIIELARD